VVEIHPSENPDGSEPPEPPLLAAHPWRLPIFLAIAFAVTVTVTVMVVRQGPPRTHVSRTAAKR